MGTNYYLDDTCHHCKHTRRLHIGKSSAGWVFALHVYPDDDPPLEEHGAWKRPVSLLEWLGLFSATQTESKPGARTVQIVTEYGNRLTPLEMVAAIVCRESFAKLSSEEEMGPGCTWDSSVGLWRTSIEQPHLHARGRGTWDELTGSDDGNGW